MLVWLQLLQKINFFMTTILLFSMAVAFIVAVIFFYYKGRSDERLKLFKANGELNHEYAEIAVNKRLGRDDIIDKLRKGDF